LRQLFSTFPGGGAGIGLLLVRCALGLTGITDGVVSIVRGADLPTRCFGAVLAAAGMLVVVGLFTSSAGVAIALCAAFRALSLLTDLPSNVVDGPLRSAVISVLGIAVALLGPGAFSVDFRLFGRREIIIPRSSGPESPQAGL
jgi:hypothetical protein